MSRIADDILDDIRARLPVSAVVGRKVRLKRAGKEWVGLSPFNAEKTPSFYCNDVKQFYHCFSSGRHGDVFKFLMETDGVSFTEAVAQCAGEAGVAMPNGSGARMLSPEEQEDRQRDRERRAAENAARRAALAEKEADEERRELRRIDGWWSKAQKLTRDCHAYRYLEERGVTIPPSQLEFVRFDPEHEYWGSPADGVKEAPELLGKFPAMLALVVDPAGETIGLHRTYLDPDAPAKLKPPGAKANRPKKIYGSHLGGFIPLCRKEDLAAPTWAIGEGIETTLSWRALGGGEDRRLALVSGVALGNIMGDSAGSRPHPTKTDKAGKPVPIPNGEPDMTGPGLRVPDHVHSLILLCDGDSDAPATTTRMLTAARRFSREGKQVELSPAKPGKDFNDELLEAGDREVDPPRAITLSEFEGETAPLLLPPYQSRFGRVAWADIGKGTMRRHEWLVRGIMTRGEQGLIVGASQAGKSFVALQMALCIATGTKWFGAGVRQGLVVYHAGESATGVDDKRVPAMRKAMGLDAVSDVPFELLTRQLDLYSSDADCDALIKELEWIQSLHPTTRLEVLFVDTYSAVTPGSDENASKDVSGVRKRVKRIQDRFGCAVILVHHKNAVGNKPRGHTSMFADVENVLDVQLITEGTDEHGKPRAKRDFKHRKLRLAEVAKLKDGEDGKRWQFVLEGVELSEELDEDGNVVKVGSCIPALPDLGNLRGTDKQPELAARIPTQPYLLLRAIERAIEEAGVPAPPELRIGDTLAVEWRVARQLYERSAWVDPPETETDKERVARLNRERQAMSRNGAALMERELVGRATEGGRTWVWRTPRAVLGKQPLSRQRNARGTENNAGVTPGGNADVTDDVGFV